MGGCKKLLILVSLFFFPLFGHCAVLSCSVMSDSLQLHGLWPARLLCSWDFPGKNTGVGCYTLLQGIFPTQGSSPGLPHCRRIFTIRATREAQEGIGVGGLALLQKIFLTQESNQGFLQCRRILCQLNYPPKTIHKNKLKID